MSSNNNQINVPQAREAMDKFKMQAANDFDGPPTSRNDFTMNRPIQK